MQLTKSPPAGWMVLTIRSRSHGSRLTVFWMMIISSRDYLTPGARTTSANPYPIRFVIEALKSLKNRIFAKKRTFDHNFFGNSKISIKNIKVSPPFKPITRHKAITTKLSIIERNKLWLYM